ncbi:MAG: hypothetical protein WB992_20995 [Bryobacteraceae bacterium]
MVESTRFAFDCDTDRIKEQTRPDGVITKTLGAGSVRCVLEVEEDGEFTEYTVERELDGRPRIMREGSRDILGQDILREIEIYSQGALQQIASSDKPQLRLNLIDRPNRAEIDALKLDVEENIAELRLIGSKLRVLRGDIEKRRLETRDLDQLRSELGQTVDNRPKLPPSLEEHHALYIRRHRVLEAMAELHVLQKRLISDVQILTSNRPKLDAIRNSLHEVAEEHLHVAHKLVDRFASAIGSIDSSGAEMSRLPIGEERQRLAGVFEQDNEIYYQLRQQEQAVSESLKREDAVRRRLAELEKSDRDLKELTSDRELILQRRKALRDEVTRKRDLIFEMRVRQAEQINREFGSVILLAVRRAAHSKPFVTRLSELLAGSRIRTQGNIAEELTTSFSPSDLLEVIESADAQRLAALLSRDLGQITRVITYLRDHSELYDLEGELFDDSLEITMFDHGQPKPIEQLSEGQRATALLPLILRSASCPLIFDQPEDDLDNSFIFQVLVKNILHLKHRRQLIFVTHNANIPVLGEAERIVVMEMERPTKAAPAKTGTLDERKEEILHLLEGGKEAFEHRERRYRSLLQ